MYTIFDLALISGVPLVFSAIPTITTWRVIALTGLAVVIVVSGTSLWLGRHQTRAKFFLGPLNTIPNEESEGVWEGWLLKMEALLRGKGLKKKSDILRSIIKRADLLDRHEIAENFFRGLAQEAIENHNI